ncbi:MAG: fimbrial protein [Rikenellaceae bacterium]
MKKILLSMAVMTAVFFASCSKDSDTINQELATPVEGSVITLSFTEESSTTRAFFDDDAAAEDWEKELKSVTIFAFNSATDELVVRRDFTSTEMTAKECTFALPDIYAGDAVSVVVVANCDIPTSVTKFTTLKATINSNLSQYNGTFSEVSTGAKRDDGFVMTSYEDVIILAGTTSIYATLERTVAKVAIEMALADTFSDRYPGDVLIESVKVSNTPSTTTLYSTFAFASTPAKDYSFTQTPNSASGKFQSLLYIYESDAPSSNNDKVLVTIEATYDMDGDFSTTGDQTPMTYTLTLEDDDIQKIKRNSYYRISGTINGLSGSDAEIFITVSNWSTVTDKDITLGN